MGLVTKQLHTARPTIPGVVSNQRVGRNFIQYSYFFVDSILTDCSDEGKDV